ncbi:MAG: hypothetical protein CM15mP108_1060 [Gammaproteobacteria bacterium]|nr:MAG: hypothetical protein CM15mP108_1060 [Gammaproteobacteria bacterium]
MLPTEQQTVYGKMIGILWLCSYKIEGSEIFGVDIHPAAKIKGGVMIDHATVF